ncbi:hypothetical protein N9A34_01280 [Candidatus Pelagibacter sp.]|nr:hypothetical protein [Candidatus Pelagibacter sp.]
MKKIIITSNGKTRFSKELSILNFNEIIFDSEGNELLNLVLDLENINSIIKNVSK